MALRRPTAGEVQETLDPRVQRGGPLTNPWYA